VQLLVPEHRAAQSRMIGSIGRNSPLRVTHLIPQIGIGGSELQLCRLIRESSPDRAAHRVLYYSDSLDSEGLRVYERAGILVEKVDRRGGPAFFIPRLIGAVRGGSPDVLHCWLVSAALWGRLAGVVARVPDIILSFRSSVIDEAPTLRVARVLDGRRVRYLANTGAVADSLQRRLGVPRARITVIPNGLDPREYAGPGERDGLLRQNGCPPDTHIVLSVGRLTAAKNYEMLLRIATRFRNLDKVHFFIAGHGELEHYIKALAERLAVSDRVHFLGLRRDIPALMASADVFCYTSRFEGFPNALLEAMASGLPIVTTRFTGVEEIIDQNRTGLVVPQDDDAAAFDALQRLRTEPGTARSVGEAARLKATRSFSTTTMVNATLDYYEQARRRG
jgi:glycosyltransferase involved in cell wall biosynthesis